MRNRQGSYKKILFTTDQLLSAKERLHITLTEMSAMNLSDQDYTTLYILLFLKERHPINFLQKHNSKTESKNQKWPLLLDILPPSFDLNQKERTLLQQMTGPDLFYDFHLKSIPKSVHRAMIHWYNGEWEIIKMHHIPSPYELLKIQAKNQRLITLIADEERIATHILASRDPLSFALHDLMHADQFFNNTDSYKGQLGLYRLMAKNYELEALQLLLKSNKQFKKEFDYVISDMNAYIIHLLKCLKSTFSRIDSESVFFQLMADFEMNQELISYLHKLNHQELLASEETQLRKFFET